MALDEKGHEKLDPTPIARPIGWRAPPSINQMIQEAVRFQLSQHAANHGRESFEEADDFDVDDDPDLKSPYEITADQEQLPRYDDKDTRKRVRDDTIKHFAPKDHDPEPEPKGKNRATHSPPGKSGPADPSRRRRVPAEQPDDEGEP